MGSLHICHKYKLSPLGDLTLFAFVFLFILISGMYDQSVSAHASPISYSPMSNSVVGENGTLPERVVVEYTEGPEPKASYIRVTNSENERVDNNDYRISESNAREASVSLDTSKFELGIYTVTWLALSKDDGHISKGSYVFTVTTTERTSNISNVSSPIVLDNATAAANTFVDSVIVDGVNITYSISPFYSGVNNNFTVTLTELTGNPPTNIRTVFLIFDNEQAGLGPISTELNKIGDGVYSAIGGYLSQPGKWEVKIIAQRVDAYDLNHSFDININNPSAN